MDIKEIKDRYTDELLDLLTTPDKSGRGYICPVCGAGDGKHGTGLVKVKNRHGYFHCFSSGCDFHGDILQLIGAVYHLNDTREQIIKAGELLHIDLTGKEEWKREKQMERDYTAAAKRTNAEPKVSQPAEKPSAPADNNIANEIKEFMAECSAAFTKDSAAGKYVNERGISFEVAKRFGLGYCPNYNRDGMNTPALIIPTGPDSYTARSLTDNGSRKVRKRKAGDRAGIFNIDCVKEDAQVVTYIVEGEIDALSIIKCGCQAIATGGGTGKRALVEELHKINNQDTLYVVLPDNDVDENGMPDRSKGYKQGLEIKKMLEDAELPAAFFDTSNARKWPKECKDVNDYLVADLEGCRNFLQGIRQWREDKILGRTSGYMQKFVEHVAGKSAPISTGFPSLDNLLDGGLHPGLICIGAISSLGKTTFILALADNLARNGQDVLIFSLEMSRYELISKIISKRTAIKCISEVLPLTLAKTNYGISDYDRYSQYNDTERRIIKECMDEFTDDAAKHIFIHEGVGNMGADEIEEKIKQHIRITKKNPVVMIDYLQVLAPADPRSTDKQNTDRNILSVKRISRDYNVPVVAISSFNREAYDEPVSMRSFKESGNIEFGSDQLIGLQYMGMDYVRGEKKEARSQRIFDLIEENKRLSKSGKPIQIQLKILKNRSGPKGDTGLMYNQMFNYYTDPEAEDPDKCPF